VLVSFASLIEKSALIVGTFKMLSLYIEETCIRDIRVA